MSTYRNCCNCSKSFVVPPNNKIKKFCTQSCATIFQNSERDYAKRISYANNPNYCKHCECALPYDIRRNQFCTRSCAGSAHKNHITHGKGLSKQCINCGHTTKNEKYCSKKCSANGKIKYTTAIEALKIKRARQNEAYARYAAKKKHQTPSDADLTLIKEFYKNCPIGYEVDHIVPISKGGLHSITNLQYLTVSENRKKGASLNWRRQE